MKNGVECYKDFFPYFKTLKTNSAKYLRFIPSINLWKKVKKTMVLFFKFLWHPQSQQRICENMQYLFVLLECALTSQPQKRHCQICILKIDFFQRLMEGMNRRQRSQKTQTSLAVRRGTAKHFENSEWCSEASRYKASRSVQYISLILNWVKEFQTT